MTRCIKVGKGKLLERDRDIRCAELARDVANREHTTACMGGTFG